MAEVPSPEQAARRQAVEPASAVEEGDAVEPQRGRKRWWIWTIVGVVAVAGGVTAGLLIARDPGVGEPPSGNTGVVISTIEVRR